MTTPGETVRVRRILFGAVRSLCNGRGLSEGAVVRRRKDRGDTLVLETPGGDAVTLDRRWARFVQVEPGHSLDPFHATRRGLRPAGRPQPARA